MPMQLPQPTVPTQLPAAAKGGTQTLGVHQQPLHMCKGMCRMREEEECV